MPYRGTILVVDDDPPIIEFIAEALADEGYVVRTALTASEAQRHVAEHRPDLVLLDLHMPEMTGIELARDFKNDGLADVPIVLMTADAQAASTLATESIAYCLQKPFDLDDLVNCIAKHAPHTSH